jgi:Tfp pilus assembly protein PilF/thiol-disulfide isomerase/thioredoxin
VEASQYSGSDLRYAEATAELNRQVDEGTSWSGNERNQVFLNLGTAGDAGSVPRFADISAVSGFDFPDDSRALAALDWDHDGDLDFVTTNRTAPRFRLFENTLPARPDSSLLVKLTGTRTNRDAIGSRLTLRLTRDGRPIELHRTLRAGEGFLSQSSKWIHFGLPPDSAIEELTVHWYGAPSETYQGLEPGGFLEIMQGKGVSRKLPVSPLPRPQKKRAGPEPSPLVHLRRPHPLPDLPYQTTDGKERTLSSAGTTPILLVLWASWCPDCRRELAHLTESAEIFRRAGFQVLALAVDVHDDPNALATANSLLLDIAFPFEVGIATPKTLELLHLVHGNLFLRPKQLPVPASLVLGPGARLSSLARGPVTVAELRPLLESPPSTWPDLAWSAGPGLWHHGPDPIPYSALAKEFLDRGWLAEAAHYLQTRHQDLLADGRIHAELLMAVGTRLLDNSQPEEGTALLKLAVESAPDLAAARNNLAVAHLRNGSPEQAAPHLKAALALDSSFVDARLNLVRYHLDTRDPASAQTLLDPLLAEGYHPKGMRLQARIHLLRNDSAALLRVFQTIANKEPTNATTWVNLAKLQQQLGQIEEAIQSYQTAASLHPDDANLGKIIDQLRLLLPEE